MPEPSATSRHSRVGGGRPSEKKAGQKNLKNFQKKINFARRRQGRKYFPGGRPESGQAPPRSGQVGEKNSGKFGKFREISKKTQKTAKIGQKMAKKRVFAVRAKISKPRNFKNFGKNAISGHRLGIFEILARRGVSSLFRFMRIDPSPYRTKKRLSEFNSGL